MRNSTTVIFVKWITVKGKRLYASQYGLKAFPITVSKKK